MTCPAHDLAVTRRFLDWADVDLIRELVADLPAAYAPLILDIGAGSGTTAAAVFAARPDAWVTTVDVNQDNLNSAEEFLRVNGYVEQWAQVCADSVVAAEHFDDGSAYRGGPFDMLLIDSSHEYEHTVAELVAWTPKVRKRGLVWCHDYRGAYPGVTRAVDEAVARGELEEIAVKGLGWGGRKV